jgi:hypothetical protein
LASDSPASARIIIIIISVIAVIIIAAFHRIPIVFKQVETRCAALDDSSRWQQRREGWHIAPARRRSGGGDV